MHAVMTGGFATVAGKFTDTQIFHVKKGFSCSPSVHGVCLCVKYKSKENWKKKIHFAVTHMGSGPNQFPCSAHCAVWGQPL